MAKLLFLSPMVPSTDVPATVRFLEVALRFSPKMLGTYAVCERDGLTIHLQPMGEGVGQMAVYLEVDDIEATWSELQPHLDGIRHRPPHDRDYGMREIHLHLPHTHALVFVGQKL